MLVVSVILIVFFVNFYSMAYSHVISPYLSRKSLKEVSTETILSMLDESDISKLDAEDYRKELQDEFLRLGYSLMVARDSDLIIGSPNDGASFVMQELKSGMDKEHDFSMIYETSSLNAVSKVRTENNSNYMFVAIRITPNFLLSFSMDYGNQSSTVYIFFIVEVFLLICVVWITSLYFSRKTNSIVLKPLKKLRNAARNVHKGNYDSKIEYEGISEFEEVCSAFNDMQSEIKANISRIKEQEKSRTEMVAGISHDLRTPLTSIKGYIKGIMDGVANTPEKQRKYIDTIYEQSKKMSMLLDRLFMLSNLETKAVPFSFETVKIKNYMEKFYEHMSDEFEYAHGTINFSSNCSDETEVRVDTLQLNRVFDNLVANSKLYSGVSNPIIDISLEESEDEVIINFQDNGNGVLEEFLPHIFDSLYRSDSARHSHGNGLGLTISKRIVEIHGGKISAQNNHGLLIIISLPKVK